MPRVKVKYFAGLRELLGNTKEEEYKAKDRSMLMDLLLKHIPERHACKLVDAIDNNCCESFSYESQVLP